MKKFNLEQAKAGKPVCTRDGRDVDIIKFDLKDDNYPLVTVIDSNGGELIYSHTEKGSWRHSSDLDSQSDLLMKDEKKTGWVNVYRFNEVAEVGVVFENMDKAKQASLSGSAKAVATIKIEWEE